MIDKERVGHTLYHPENVANAQLISAAPELFLARYVVEHPYAAYGMGDQPHAQRVEMQRLAAEAITKATGGHK